MKFIYILYREVANTRSCNFYIDPDRTWNLTNPDPEMNYFNADSQGFFIFRQLKIIGIAIDVNSHIWAEELLTRFVVWIPSGYTEYSQFLY